MTNAFGEVAYLLEHAVDGRHDILAINIDRAVAAIPQCSVQYGTVFGDIDFLAAEHSVAPLFDVTLACKFEEQGERFVGDAVLGEVQQDVLEPQCEKVESDRILSEEIAHVDHSHALVVRLKRRPCARFGEFGHGWFPRLG